MSKPVGSLEEQLRGVVTMLVVNDLGKSVEFYRQNLGFRVISKDDHIAGLVLGGMQLYLFGHSPPTPDKPNITITNLNTPDKTAVILDFLVKDCQSAYELLREKGVEFLTEPTVPPWGGLRCFARDLDGYLIELEENPNSPFLADNVGVQ